MRLSKLVGFLVFFMFSIQLLANPFAANTGLSYKVFIVNGDTDIFIRFKAEQETSTLCGLKISYNIPTYSATGMIPSTGIINFQVKRNVFNLCLQTFGFESGSITIEKNSLPTQFKKYTIIINGQPISSPILENN